MQNIFSPLQLRSLTIKNRIAVSPMQQYSAINGFVNDWHLVHLGSRAVGGAGLVLTEALPISLEGRWTDTDLGIWSDGHIEGLTRIVQFVQSQGAVIGAQIGHAGAKASRFHPRDGFTYRSIENGGWQTVSSSAQTPFRGMSKPIALDPKGIQKVISDFQRSAQRAVQAGFDTIEIHAAHGYILHQFYSALVNDRIDQYGGTFENRIRLTREVVQAIRQVIPESMPLLIRISAVDFLKDEKAWKIEDSVKLIKTLKEDGVDLVTASAGGFVYLDKSKVYPSYQVPFAHQIKQDADIQTGAVGLITEAKQANEIIQNEQADLVLLAREYLRNPYFALHAAKELGIKIKVPEQYKRAF